MLTYKMFDEKEKKEQTVLIGINNTDLSDGMLFIPYDVTVIGEEACADRLSLQSLHIQGNVEKIEAMAFCNCPFLEYVSMGDNVKEIKKWAFRGTKIKSIDLPAKTKVDRDAFDENVKIKRVNEKNIQSDEKKDNCEFL